MTIREGYKTDKQMEDMELENHTIYSLLSGVHSHEARLVRVGVARPPPFITFTITSKVAVYAPAEWADTLTLFHI